MWFKERKVKKEINPALMGEKFVPPVPLKTAVLFMVFNRPDTTQQVFESIRKAKPPRLYVAADGPREDKDGEAEVVQKTRKLVMDNIDWNCEVKTLFREKNLGCKYAVSGAIDWFFENEEQGIILEDDCLPSQSFFWFCEELLRRYRTDLRIGHIGGTQPIWWLPVSDSYIVTRYNRIWGWATWRRSWLKYDAELCALKEVENNPGFIDLFENVREYRRYLKIFKKCKDGLIDTWDYQWFFSRVIHSLAIQPSINLVTNIGFGGNATHTSSEDHWLSGLPRHELSWPLHHPRYMYRKVDFDSTWAELSK